MYAKFVGTLIVMSFHASVWLHVARALLRSYGAASGHVGPKPFPGAAPRRLRFGHSSTNNRNGGQYGYYADASRMFLIGNVCDEARKLVEVTKESVDLALKEVKPWGRLGDIGAVISEYVHQHGYTVLRDIGGHGVGNDFHEDPYVCHIGKRGTGMLLVPGMVFTIEPMVNEGKEDFFVDEENEWTVYTEDGSLSAQWEYTVAVTEDGVEIITH